MNTIELPYVSTVRFPPRGLASRAVALIFSVFLTVACTAVSGGVVLPTQPPSQGAAAALLGPVRLEQEVHGNVDCVYAVGPSFRYALVWPNGYSARISNVVSILDATGTEVAQVGQTVWLGGGLSPPPWPQLQGCPDGGNVFWVGDVTHKRP